MPVERTPLLGCASSIRGWPSLDKGRGIWPPEPFRNVVLQTPLARQAAWTLVIRGGPN